jgi:hypothetical protein
LYVRIFGIFYDTLVHSVFLWYIFLVLVSFIKKNLAILCPIWHFKLLKPHHYIGDSLKNCIFFGEIGSMKLKSPECT